MVFVLRSQKKDSGFWKAVGLCLSVGTAMTGFFLFYSLFFEREMVANAKQLLRHIKNENSTFIPYKTTSRASSADLGNGWHANRWYDKPEFSAHKHDECVMCVTLDLYSFLLNRKLVKAFEERWAKETQCVVQTLKEQRGSDE